MPQIVEVCKKPSNDGTHGHIVAVKTLLGDGLADLVQWPVDTVRQSIRAGMTFFTSNSKGIRAEVQEYDCPVALCGVKTIRTVSDATTANNLDNLPTFDCLS